MLFVLVAGIQQSDSRGVHVVGTVMELGDDAVWKPPWRYRTVGELQCDLSGGMVVPDGVPRFTC